MSNVSYRNLSDEDLLFRVAERKDQEAMNMLYRRYAHLVMGVGLKYLPYEDAQDIIQQVFIKIWNDAAKYSVKVFKPWLYTVVKNQCLMELRKKNPVVELPENGFDFVEYEDRSHHTMEQEKVLTILESCMQKLQQAQKACIELFYQGQKTYSEVAIVNNMTDREVKTHLQNGRRNLKICFSQHKNN